jgi:hypothetical protein
MISLSRGVHAQHEPAVVLTIPKGEIIIWMPRWFNVSMILPEGSALSKSCGGVRT